MTNLAAFHLATGVHLTLMSGCSSYLIENTVHFYSVDQPVSDAYGKNKYLLDAFGKLRRATISFVMSVRLSACNNSAPTGRIFMEFDIFRKYIENFKFH